MPISKEMKTDLQALEQPVHSLLSCPCDDVNFTRVLKNATNQNLIDGIMFCKKWPAGRKGKIKSLGTEVLRREPLSDEGIRFAARQLGLPEDMDTLVTKAIKQDFLCVEAPQKLAEEVKRAVSQVTGDFAEIDAQDIVALFGAFYRIWRDGHFEKNA